MFVVLLPAQKQVEYSPEAYKIIKEACQKTQVPKGLNGSLLKTMQVEFPKLMALSPSSLSKKMKGMCQCAINEGRLKANELELINAFFTARENQNIKHAVYILKSFVKLPNKSEVMNSICNAMDNFTTETEPEDPPADDPPADDDDFHDNIETILVTSSAIAGAIIAGKRGAKYGAKLGEISAKAHKAIYKAIYGGVMLGPNGEDCTPPFIITFPETRPEY